jgi:DNA polymerase III epsilon subunit-like protein
MKVLVFDTETTGLPPFNRVPTKYNIKDWPYIVQFSFIIYDITTDKIITEYDNIIKIPNNIIITEENSKIHGITNSISKTQGYDIKDVINIFKVAVQNSDMIVGHNIEFDVDMLIAECLRNDIEIKELDKLNKYCTMTTTKNLCNIKKMGKYGREYIKYPSLLELHTVLFESQLNNLHNSFVDILVCLRCYYKITFDKDLCRVNKRFNSLYKKNTV